MKRNLVMATPLYEMNAQLRRSRDVDQGVEATLLPNWIKLPVGFSVLVLSVAAGEQIKSWLHLPIPGNVLGLSILVLCFRLRLIQPALIKEAASRLLYLLPALFIPVFVSAVGSDQLWSRRGWIFLPALLAATASLWIFVGHLAQYLLSRTGR